MRHPRRAILLRQNRLIQRKVKIQQHYKNRKKYPFWCHVVIMYLSSQILNAYHVLKARFFQATKVIKKVQITVLKLLIAVLNISHCDLHYHYRVPEYLRF